MKKLGKKLMALGLAGVMVLGMSGVTAFADTATTFDVPITQTIYFKNADAATVYEPDITYTYTIKPGAAGKTVTDQAGVTVSVKAGDMRGFGVNPTATTPQTADTDTKAVTINFAPGHASVTADAAGKVAVTKKVTVQFDGSKLVTAAGDVTPGVYRYILTQTTTTDEKKAVGIEEVGTQDKTLVLDVTVKNDGTVVGSKIIDPTDDDPTINNKDQDNDTGKTTGFGDPEEDPTDPESPTDSDDPSGQKSKTYSATDLPDYYDLYTTYNLTVEKAVGGAMGDKSNKFDFSTAIDNSVSSAKFTVQVAGGTATTPLVSDGAVTGSLKHGETIVITGLPMVQTATNLTLTTTETNNTADTYKTKAEFSNTTNTDVTTVKAEDNVAANGTAVGAVNINTANAGQKLTFTNTLDAISPTGVALRFAPYILMLGAAMFLVAFTRRRRVED